MGSQIFYPVKFTGYFRTRVGDGLRQHYVAVKTIALGDRPADDARRLAAYRRPVAAQEKRFCRAGLENSKKRQTGKCPSGVQQVQQRWRSSGAAERGGLQGESKTFGVHPELDLTDYGIHACNRGEVGKSKSKAKKNPKRGQVFSNLVAVTTNQLLSVSPFAK